MTSGTQFGFFGIVISREDVEAGDISGTASVLAKLLNPDAALMYCEKVDFSVLGYGDDHGN